MTIFQRSSYLVCSLLCALILSGCGGSSNNEPNQATLVISTAPNETISKIGSNGNGSIFQALDQDSALPLDVQELRINVFDSQDVLIATRTLGAFGGDVNLNVRPDIPLTVNASALNGGEVLYEGSRSVEPLAVNEARSIAITLSKTFSMVITPSSTEIEPLETVALNAAISGLNDNTIIYSVNDVVGGNNALGTIDEDGIYTLTTSNEFPADTPVALRAFPIGRPSLGETADVLVTVSAVWDEFNWDEGWKWQ